MNKKGMSVYTIGMIIAGLVILLVLGTAISSFGSDFFEGVTSPLDIFLSEKIDYPDYEEPSFGSVSVTEQGFVSFMNHVNSNYNSFRDDTRSCSCGSSCEDYASSIFTHASDKKVDPILVLSLLIQESNCRLGDSTDSSHGLMQINCRVWYNDLGYGSERACIDELLGDYDKNIEAGVSILAGYYYGGNRGGSEESFEVDFNGCSVEKSYTGWLAALRSYNGLGCNPNYPKQDLFVPDIVKRYNVLVNEYNRIT